MHLNGADKKKKNLSLFEGKKEGGEKQYLKFIKSQNC